MNENEIQNLLLEKADSEECLANLFKKTEIEEELSELLANKTMVGMELLKFSESLRKDEGDMMVYEENFSESVNIPSMERMLPTEEFPVVQRESESSSKKRRTKISQEIEDMKRQKEEYHKELEFYNFPEKEKRKTQIKMMKQEMGIKKKPEVQKISKTQPTKKIEKVEKIENTKENQTIQTQTTQIKRKEMKINRKEEHDPKNYVLIFLVMFFLFASVVYNFYLR